VGNRFTGKFFDVLKNVGDEISGNFPEIFFNALPESQRIRFHLSGSHYTLFELGKAYRAFIPSFCDHGKIMQIFFQVLVFREREDDGDLVPVLINDILFDGTHKGFLIIHCICLMI
jgi:hypothetical protein